MPKELRGSLFHATMKSAEKVVKKNKQRKPMSQSYVNKPWNREDAERALKIENEYNLKNKVNAQSLIIKFPDTDLNKDIVGQFHPEILNIHFPCGPRYCFIQMAEDVNIDEAIKELEKIKFGVGHLKVERKSLRDEDNPEEIDPYTLFIGNLPESVKTSEIKSKFPKAQDEETRKMKNTRNVFMRYNSVDDAISDYKQAYGLMLDKRSIIVKFRRKEGNAYLSEEPKLDVKKVKEEPSNAAQVDKELNHVGLELNVNELKEEESNTDEKTKENKMSQSYPSKPWNREDAERALMTENEYNMKNKVNAQRLIIKFPDPNLNKDIVRLFHPGIRNIHFQNPSGPRYCFIQMAKSVNIDQAIKELEKVKFGTGYLKVEKKAVRNEEVRNTKPEDINPYNLYIGNLPTFVKANEIKSKFPKARVDVSRGRKLKNSRRLTQFAFMRYNSVDDAIADYKKVYGLMWDTRSIIVKFSRKEGNAYLPEELKPDVKKVKEELSNAAQVEKELNANHIELKPNVNESKKEDSTGQTKENKVNHADKSSMSQDMDSVEVRLQDNSSKAQNKSALQIQENTNSHSSLSPTSITSDKTMQEQQRQPWKQEKDSDEENNAEILQNENIETNEVDVIDIGQTSTDIKQEVKVFASLEESSKVKKKKRQTQIDERIDEAYSYLAAKRRKEETSEKKQKDECDIFGELIVAKLRKFDDYTRQLIMNDINTTMFRASIQPTQSFQRDNFTQPNTFVQSLVSPLCSYSVQSSPIVSSQPSPNISYTPQPSPNTSYTPQPSPNTSHTPQPSTSASHTIT